MNNFKWRNPTPSWIESYSFNNYFDVSSTKYVNLYSEEIKSLVTHFKNWVDGPTMTWSAFKLNPVSGARVELRQADFATGTIRIRHSAHYVLMEDIIFEPNPSDDWMPTAAQTAGGAKDRGAGAGRALEGPKDPSTGQPATNVEAATLREAADGRLVTGMAQANLPLALAGRRSQRLAWLGAPF